MKKSRWTVTFLCLAIFLVGCWSFGFALSTDFKGVRLDGIERNHCGVHMLWISYQYSMTSQRWYNLPSFMYEFRKIQSFRIRKTQTIRPMHAQVLASTVYIGEIDKIYNIFQCNMLKKTKLAFGTQPRYTNTKLRWASGEYSNMLTPFSISTPPPHFHFHKNNSSFQIHPLLTPYFTAVRFPTEDKQRHMIYLINVIWFVHSKHKWDRPKRFVCAGETPSCAYKTKSSHD